MYVIVNLLHCAFKHCDLDPSEVLCCRVMMRSVSIGIQGLHWRSVECWTAKLRVPVTPEIQCVRSRFSRKSKLKFQAQWPNKSMREKKKEIKWGEIRYFLFFFLMQYSLGKTHRLTDHLRAQQQPSTQEDQTLTIFTLADNVILYLIWLDLIFIKQVLLDYWKTLFTSSTAAQAENIKQRQQVKLVNEPKKLQVNCSCNLREDQHSSHGSALESH